MKIFLHILFGWTKMNFFYNKIKNERVVELVSKWKLREF